MISWLLDPRHAATITWIGFFVSLVGTILGLIGLWVALRQLKSIKTETEASRSAIESVQLKVASFDTIQECQIASGHLRTIRDLLKSPNWNEILSEYEHLMQCFLKLSYSNSAITEGERGLLNKYSEDIANICEGIRKKLAKDASSVVLRGQDRALRDFSDVIVKITFAITRDLQR